MTAPHYTVGVKFGRLTTMARGPKYTMFCRCECGAITNPAANDLKNGLTKSCGCLQREATAAANAINKTTHGMAHSPTYVSWAAMKERCLNPNHHAAHNYSARGITMDAEWCSFEKFRADMGDRPEGTTLDRIDNNAGYKADNCRWASKKDQGNNTRRNVHLTHNGETLNLAQWSSKLGIKPNTLSWRLAHGWPTDRVLSHK